MFSLVSHPVYRLPPVTPLASANRGLFRCAAHLFGIMDDDSEDWTRVYITYTLRVENPSVVARVKLFELEKFVSVRFLIGVIDKIWSRGTNIPVACVNLIKKRWRFSPYRWAKRLARSEHRERLARVFHEWTFRHVLTELKWLPGSVAVKEMLERYLFTPEET